MVSCVTCGISYDVSARTGREIKAGRVKARCHLHRRRKRDLTVTAEHRRYWLCRFTLDEIRDMAEALWPLPSQRGAATRGVVVLGTMERSLSLTASSESPDDVST